MDSVCLDTRRGFCICIAMFFIKYGVFFLVIGYRYKLKMDIGHIQQDIQQAVQQAVREENHSYIISIYVRIVNRLSKWVPETSKKRLEEQFDVEFFTQLLKHRQFDWKSLHGLTNTTFKWIHDLQMPIRDSSTEAARQRVLAVSIFPEAIGMYVNEVDKTLHLMEKDMQEFIQNKDHPDKKNMLEQAISKLKP